MTRGSGALFSSSSSSSLINKSLFEILVCPLSKQPLRVCQESQSLVSDAIGVSFPIVDGVPLLVPKDGKVLEDDDRQKSDVADTNFQIRNFKEIIVLTKSPATLNTVDDGELECCVCLSRLVEGNGTRKLPCCHLFHRECVDKWLVLCQSTCPLCRLSINCEPMRREMELTEELMIWFSSYYAPGF